MPKPKHAVTAPGVAPSDARLLEAERMSQSLASHQGAAPGMRRLAEDMVAALRRVTDDQRAVAVLIASGARQGDATDADALRHSLHELDARAAELLGAIDVLYGVVVRRDEYGTARVLVEAQRTLAELQALIDGARMLEEDEG